MKSVRVLFVCLVVIWLAVPGAGATLPSLTSQIVTCHEGVDADALIKEFNLSPTFVYRYGLNGFAAPMDAGTIQKLKSDGRVIAVEWDSPVELCDQTNSTGFVRLGIAKFPMAHINGTNDPLNVGVAILDTGIDPGQLDLNLYTNFSTVHSDGSDWSGHGTEVAGVLCANDNALGVVGVAPGVQLWNVQVIGSTLNSWSVILGGMVFVLQHSNEISVVNMSFINPKGSSAPWTSIHSGIASMVQSGIVVVAGAGNDAQDLAGLDGIYGTSDDAVPAALPEVMAVSGMDSSLDENGNSADIFYSASNFSQIQRTNGFVSGETNYVFSPGGAIDVAAPSVNILTTGTNNTYVIVNGTSFAAPHVVGLVALYIAANGRATNAAGVYAIRQAIVNNSLLQSQWNSAPNTFDPDSNPEPLAMPSEDWVPQPFITSAGNFAGGFQLNFDAVPGYNYTAQYATALTTSTQWTNVSTVVGVGNRSPTNIIDATTDVTRFYRLLRQPAP